MNKIKIKKKSALKKKKDSRSMGSGQSARTDSEHTSGGGRIKARIHSH
jgi:hypothetical protein